MSESRHSMLRILPLLLLRIILLLLGDGFLWGESRRPMLRILLRVLLLLRIIILLLLMRLRMMMTSFLAAC